VGYYKKVKEFLYQLNDYHLRTLFHVVRYTVVVLEPLNRFS
jgi:hypothetical protein